MRKLAQADWRTLTLAEFADRRTAHAAQRTFLLTFDDGYESLAQNAYPVLADLGFTATTFLVTDYVGKTNTWDVRYTWRRLPHLSWGQVEHWRGRGFDFASHTASHRRLTWLPDLEVEAELHRSRDVLTGRLGPEAGRAIAYPFGAVNAQIIRHARQAGYELGFGGVRGDDSPLETSRFPVYFWDAGSVPFGLRTGFIGGLGKIVAHAANRCAVGTSVMLGLKQKTWQSPGSVVGASPPRA